MAKKASLGGNPRLFNLFRNWIHQALFYLDKTELFSRVVIEVFFILILAIFFAGGLDYASWSPWDLFFSFFIVHTLNWIFNGNWWACILFAFPNLKNPGEYSTCQYLNNMATRLRNSSSISAILVFGSISREKWHGRSDIDMRILRKTGLFNAISAVMIQMRERFYAFFSKQPLDMYLADNIEFFKNLREDEYPICLLLNDNKVKKIYPTIKEKILKKL
ncbi:MAG: hypothetical protein WC123_03785 [Bacilli bacterium]